MAANTATCVGTQSASIDPTTGVRTYDVLYQVETTDVDDQALTAVQAIGIPSTGQFYAVGNDSDPYAFVQRYRPTQTSFRENQKLWDVVVSFSTSPAGEDSTGNGQVGYDFPWQKPTKVRGGGQRTQEQALRHYPNKAVRTLEPLTNSANAHFEDEYREVSAVGLTLIKNYYWENWGINDVIDYVDTVNTAEFFDGPVGYYKMAMPVFELLYTAEGLAYWQVTYQFEGQYGGWNDKERPDEGYYYLDNGVTLKRFGDELERPLSGKGRLNGTDGDKLDPWQPTETITVNKYFTQDFGDLPIPQNVEDIIQRGQ